MKKENVVKKIIEKGCLLIIILTLVLRVGNAQVKYVKSFPQTYNVKIDSIQIPPVLLFEGKMIVTCNKLVSFSSKSDTIFRVFSLPDCKYLGAFGRKGNGPNEFNRLSPTSIRPSLDGFIVKDLKFTREIIIPDGVVSDNTIEQKILSRNEGSLLVLNQSIKLNDSITLGVLLSSSPKELSLFNHSRHEYDYAIEFPTDYKKVPERVRPFFWVKDLDISPDKSKLVYSYRYIPKIRIVDLATNRILSDKNLDFGPEQIDIKFTDNSFTMDGLMTYYTGVIAKSDYFYAFYCLGRISLSDGFISLPTREIHKYNWDGDPVAIFPLPQWAKLITITDDNSRVYFLHPDIEDRIYFMNLKRNDIDE